MYMRILLLIYEKLAGYSKKLFWQPSDTRSLFEGKKDCCDIVTRRAARLAAAGIVGILKKIGRDGSGSIAGGRMKGKAQRMVVAIEGGLYATHAIFREYLNEAVVEILGEVARNVIFRVSEDGSGIGAALLAAAGRSILAALFCH